MSVKSGYTINLLVITLLLSVYICLTFFYIDNPIRTPVTDDWLYLTVGTHEISTFRLDSFELVNGHQQFLVKTVVWLLGFFPGSYYSYIWAINGLVAFLGFYLLIISQINHLGAKFFPFRVVILVVVLCNFKPLYLYMSFTGTGLCLTVLCFGIYYYSGSHSTSKKNEFTKDLCAFLAPFATGFGISLAMAHLVQLLNQGREGFSLNLSRFKLIRMIITVLGMTLAYLLPLVYGLANPRSPGDTSSRISNVLKIFTEPLMTIRFVCGLFGSTLVPSSRFEPWLPMTVGSILLILIILALCRYFTLRTFSQTILLNETPFLGGFIFVLMLLVFRGLGNEGSVNESLAPRFVMGTSILLFSIICLIFQKHNSDAHLKLPTYILIVMMLFSASGVKTGLEWLSVRSQQTERLYSCLEVRASYVQDCLGFALPIQEGESSEASTLSDLRRLASYLK